MDRVIELAATGGTAYSDEAGFISVDGVRHAWLSASDGLIFPADRSQPLYFIERFSTENRGMQANDVLTNG